ncbi:MAG: hypothetical protein ABIP37_06035, partial [Methylotenera sp.]
MASALLTQRLSATSDDELHLILTTLYADLIFCSGNLCSSSVLLFAITLKHSNIQMMTATKLMSKFLITLMIQMSGFHILFGDFFIS